jgi:chloramphenicol O-acetyltransferase
MTEPKTEISKVIKPDQIGYFDNLLGMLKLEDGEKKLEDFLREDFRENFENNLKNYILRYKELGSVFATKDSNSRFMQFLDETRQIYVQGQYIAIFRKFFL